MTRDSDPVFLCALCADRKADPHLCKVCMRAWKRAEPKLASNQEVKPPLAYVIWAAERARLAERKNAKKKQHAQLRVDTYWGRD